MGRLDERVAIVTGSARGLGEGIARKLAEEGAVVVCADVVDASDTAASLKPSASGRRGKAVHLDVTDTAQVERVFNEVAQEYGSLDILCNNAGVAQPILSMLDTTDEVVDRVLAVNVRGVLACSRAAGRIMLAQGSGRIINTASQVGKNAWPGWGIYSASKAAVIAITQVMARELAPTVVVNAICPGTMLTDMTRTGFRAGAAEGEDWEANLAEHTAAIPFKRLGTPEDMGNLAAWLASDECSFTTGAAINLTGGEVTFF
jgi:3-oxoacyl-[acyl-carrier protein] reductase